MYRLLYIRYNTKKSHHTCFNPSRKFFYPFMLGHNSFFKKGKGGKYNFLSINYGDCSF